MKSILLLIAFFIVGIYPVYAHDHHDHDERETKVEKTRTNVAADQVNLDWSTTASQVSGGFGSDRSMAISYGKKIDRILWTGMITSDSLGDDYAGVGFTKRFK